MFKKKPTIKPLAPLRSSDRRKIADQIIADFHVEIPATPEEHPQTNGDQAVTPASAVAPTAAVSPAAAGTLAAIRSSIIPDNVLYGKFTTTAGPDLKPVGGVIYVGDYKEDEQRILWVKINERMYPTVHTLWKNPRLVPLLHTPANVVGKLRGGADLMIPGLTRGPPFPASATKNAIVAVASDENPSVPVFVGVCEIDVGSLQNVRGEKGKAVRGITWMGDELWEWSTDGRSESVIPENIDGWDPKEEVSTEGVTRGIDSLNVEEDEEDEEETGGVRLDDVEATADVDDADHAEPLEEEKREYTTKEIDEVFRQAFLFGLYQCKRAHPDEPHHGLNFPLTSSSVVSELITPYLPTFSAAETAAFQLKKTSWKNAKKFIKVLDKEKLVKSKERNGGETVILDIDFDDRAVVEFTPYKLPKKASTSGAGSAGSKDASKQDGDSSVGQQLRKVVLYKPKEKHNPIFKSTSSRPAYYTATEIRPMVNAYVEAESLVSPSNKRMVKLNPVLANAVFDSQSSSDREVLAKGEVARDALMERVIQACSAFWVILRNDQISSDVKPKAGSPPKVQIVMETRSGNKTVTKISGLETYHINPQPLADELQKACAGSTSVNQLVGSSPKNPVMEVMVQGPQSQPVIKALERRGVNRVWIDVVDKTKGKKRG
ncbi:MAG: hypothetical protein M1823_003741 [Watsoniomyces obsoletus]|nr:MAG: hypothetical protein M1823_003741 [Watsoniomyces obsoletus]